MPDLNRVRAGQCAKDTGECWRHLAERTEALRVAGIDHAPQPLQPLHDDLPDHIEDDAPRWFYALIGVAFGGVLGYAIRVAL